MEYGAHLPVIDFDGRGWQQGSLTAYAQSARRLGYQWLTANDHLVFQRPWLDAVVALASVLEASGELGLATSVALPVVRGAAAVAKAAAALDVLSGGRFALGVGPGSSARDYQLAGIAFEERWPRFEASLRALRSHLHASDDQTHDGAPVLRPRPVRLGGVPVWVASWGSAAGLRRVARYGDGWLASAYNADPGQIAAAHETLRTALTRYGRDIASMPCTLATMWVYVCDDERDCRARLEDLAAMLNRPPAELAPRVLVGSAQRCATTLRAYADAGVDRLFVWPLGRAEEQLERFMLEVVPAATIGA
jgi:alkanesulfonate monooxygenase SsuD/methylene tetrahydromethanopterin reductase-like flavin-dependent oxidoreductase (luciferase family)